MRRAARTRSERGFSIVEVMVSVAVFASSFVGVSSVLLSSARFNRQARGVTAAVNLAQDKLDEIRSQAYAAVASGSDAQPLSEIGAPSATAPYARSWTVTAPGPVANTKRVTVTVSWTDLGARSVTLSTVLAQ